MFGARQLELSLEDVKTTKSKVYLVCLFSKRHFEVFPVTDDSEINPWFAITLPDRHYLINNQLLRDVYSTLDAVHPVVVQSNVLPIAANLFERYYGEYVEDYIDKLQFSRRMLLHSSSLNKTAIIPAFPMDISYRKGDGLFEIYCTVSNGCSTWLEEESRLFEIEITASDFLPGRSVDMIKVNNSIRPINRTTIFRRKYPRRIYPSSQLNHHLKQYYPSIKPATAAVVTAVYGGYEISCKPFARQTVETDFYCFTDNDNVAARGWIVDSIPYPLMRLRKEFESKTIDELNSYHNNQHPFNLAKYFKMTGMLEVTELIGLQSQVNELSANLFSEPSGQTSRPGYSLLVWLDGTVLVHNSQMNQFILELLDNSNEKLVVFEHGRKGRLYNEYNVTTLVDKYLKPVWNGFNQPVQLIEQQYRDYLASGYRDEAWIEFQYEKGWNYRPEYGVFLTCLLAVDLRKDGRGTTARDFLESWLSQNRKYSTQDQISFPFVAQSKGVYPIPLPNGKIYGSFSSNNIFTKMEHGT
jgi:hypothetical protein